MMMYGLRWRGVMVVAVVLGVAAVAAWAEPYWIAYEGNDYPEREGWWRIWYDIPAERRLEEGCLVLDTLSDPHITEYYAWPPSGNLDPEPGELFLMQWRVRVDKVLGDFDPHVLIGADDGWAAAFRFAEDRLRVAWVFGVEVSYQPGVFHEFELRSRDMREYDLYLDGELALKYSFIELNEYSRMTWGAATGGDASCTHWDHVRFGVVPEPSAAAGFLAMAALGAMRRTLRKYWRSAECQVISRKEKRNEKGTPMSGARGSDDRGSNRWSNTNAVIPMDQRPQ